MDCVRDASPKMIGAVVKKRRKRGAGGEGVSLLEVHHGAEWVMMEMREWEKRESPLPPEGPVREVA